MGKGASILGSRPKFYSGTLNEVLTSERKRSFITYDNDMSDYVPYEAANRDIDLGTHEIKGTFKGNADSATEFLYGMYFIDMDKYDTLSNAILDIGATETTLIVKSQITLHSSCVIPENIHLKIVKGGSIVTTGYTLTINGSFSCGLFQAFSGTGTVIFGYGVIKEAYPQWWGAKGDDSTDDTTAIQDAVDSFDNIYFPKATYKITDHIRIIRANVTLNLGKSIIKQYTKIKDIINIYGTTYFERVTIKDGFLNHNDTAGITSGNAISMEGDGLNISFIDIYNVKTENNKYGFYLNGNLTLWMASFKKFHNNNVYSGGIRINPTWAYPTTIEFEQCYTNNITDTTPGYYIRRTYGVNLRAVAVDNSTRFLDIMAGHINIVNCGAEWVKYDQVPDGKSVVYLQSLNTQEIVITGLYIFIEDTIDYTLTTGKKHILSVNYGTAIINGLDLKTISDVAILPSSNYSLLYFNPASIGLNSIINNVYIQDIKHPEASYASIVAANGSLAINNISKGYSISYANGGGSLYRPIHLSAIPSYHAIWEQGMKINKTTAASGASPGWVCTAPGSSGTLNSGNTTGSITAGSEVLVVNTIANLINGDYITIAGAGTAGADLYTKIKWLPRAVGSTTVSSSSSGTTLNVTSSANFAVGDNIVVDYGNANEEQAEIKSISGNVITLSSALANTHAIGVTVEAGILIEDVALTDVDDNAVSFTNPVWTAEANLS